MKIKSKIWTTVMLVVSLKLCINNFYDADIDGLNKETYNSNSVYVYNVTDNKEEIAINEKDRQMPASLVKIMTVYVALQNIQDLDGIAPVDVNSYKRLVKENSSMAGFVGREKTTYKDLLCGAMLTSGGECAESLAINISGSQDEFIYKMNEQSEIWGLNDTVFTITTGLDDKNQYSTAKDIAIIIKNSLADENFKTIFTEKTYTTTSTIDHTKGIVLKSTVFEKLKDYEQSGFDIVGGKSGTTYGAGLCWATLATKGGKEYIVVVMGAPFEDIKETGEGQIKDTIKILSRL